MNKLFSIILLLIISTTVLAQQKRAITVDDMWAMNRLGSYDISPDGKLIAFDTRTYKMEDNSSNSDIWIMNADGSNLRSLIRTDKNESAPKFSPDGKTILYSSGGQIWQCNIDGTEQTQITIHYSGGSGTIFSPDGKNIVFTSMVYPDCKTQDCNEEKDNAKANALTEVEVFTELFYRHWNDWRGPKISHLFFMNLASKKFVDLNEGSTADAPPIALGGYSDYTFAPSGKEIAFAMNTDKFIASSTNNDVFTLKLDGISKPVRISTSKGNDNHPAYSPDGKYIAYCSMERAGFEADKLRLMIYDREDEEANYVTPKIDLSVSQIVWSKDSKEIYFTSANEIYSSIYKLNIETQELTTILKEGVNSDLKLSADGKTLFFKKQLSNMPHELFSIGVDGSNVAKLTELNTERLAELEMNDVETFWSEGAEGAKVQSIILKPPFFDESKEYPMIFLIHGGPQGHWTDNFHYRWNTQMFASRGYVVVAPNPRGSTGYGQKFTDEISQDWGGKVYVDLMNAYDHAIATYDFIDDNNTFAAGASYGGYMINWIEGHNEKFNALVNHDGVYNLKSMYGTTEELWFPEWENGGTPWENKAMYEKWCPSNFVQNFKTPMLVVHGGMDFRVPESQAFELFTALQKMKVPSEFVYFPKETHFVLKPQNAKFWWNKVFNWYERFKR